MLGHGADPSPSARAEVLAGVGLWTLDVTTGRLTTNAAARQMLGWTEPGDPVLQDFLERVHPDDQELLGKHTGELLDSGLEYVVEHRVVLEGGRLMHLRASACAERDAAGEVTTLHGVTLDITDLRRAVEATVRHRDRSKAVLRSLSDGYLLSANGVILEVNAALCELTGFSEYELVGAGTPYPFWPPEAVDELLSVRRRLQSQGGGRGSHAVVRKDGSRVPVSFTASCLPSVDGVPLWIVLVRDVTDERARDLELERRAATDPLTGVQNSRSFRESLRAAVDAASPAEPVCLALLDVDHFKAVNDRFGHAVGDEVLRAVVERLVGATSGMGTVARVGGEEFALLMPCTDDRTARRVVESALEALRATPLPAVGVVTASAGLAQLETGMDDDALYRRADSLLYRAKALGRDRAC